MIAVVLGIASAIGVTQAQSLETPAEAAPASLVEDTPISDSVVVQFADGKTDFRPDAMQAEKLKAASAAALVVVRGRTSTASPSRSDERLALQRALSARTYLVLHGVSPLKINLNFASAADYLTENSTPEGKSANRRVEVEIIYVQDLR